MKQSKDETYCARTFDGQLRCQNLAQYRLIWADGDLTVVCQHHLDEMSLWYRTDPRSFCSRFQTFPQVVAFLEN